jgi:hypothetical protein
VKAGVCQASRLSRRKPDACSLLPVTRLAERLGLSASRFESPKDRDGQRHDRERWAEAIDGRQRNTDNGVGSMVEVFGHYARVTSVKQNNVVLKKSTAR